MATTGTVSINIVGDASRFRSALNEADSGLAGFKNRLNTIGAQMMSFGSTLTTHVTLPIVGLFALATKAAVDEQQEIAKLDQVLKNSTVITDAQRKAVEKQITAWQNATGIADGQLRPALSNLIVAGYDWKRAQELMTVAMDIAVAKGTSVESVTKAMARAAQGNTTALSRMGIATKDAGGNALTFDQILKNAAETMGGSAANAADTAAGRMAILRARFRDSVEELGNNLIPIFERIVAVVGTVIDKFNGLTPTQQKLILGALGLAAALGPLIILIGSLAVALNVLISPITLVVLAVVAVTAAIVLMWLKWDEIWNFMKDHPAIAIVVSILAAPVAALFLIIGAIKFLYENWDTIWHDIQSVTQAVWSVIEPIFNYYRDRINDIVWAVTVLRNIAWETWNTFRDAVVSFWHIVDGPLNKLLDILQKIAGAAGAVKGAVGKAIDLANPTDEIIGGGVPFVPGFASGGLIRATPGGTLIRAAEGGEDEFVIPRSKMGSAGGVNIHIGQIVTPDSESAADALVRRLRTEAFLAGM